MSRKGRASGYIIFASEYRKEATQKNPELTFGEISRFVGEKVKKIYNCVTIVPSTFFSRGNKDVCC